VKDLDSPKPQFSRHDNFSFQPSSPPLVRRSQDRHVEFVDSSDLGKPLEIDSLSSRVRFDRFPSTDSTPKPVKSRSPVKVSVERKSHQLPRTSDLETDEEIVEKLRSFLENESSEEEDVPVAEHRNHPGSQISPEIDIAARLSAFKKRTEALLDNARRTVGSTRDIIENDD
jgi:hypothetical protein